MKRPVARIRHHALRGIILAAAVLLPALAQAAPLDWMHGTWSGPGTAFGRESAARLTVGPALRDQFVELRYSLSVPSMVPALRMDAHAYYRAAPGSGLVGSWFDSRGISLPLAAEESNGGMTVEWGAEGTERGRTQYRLTGANEIELIDFSRLPDGTYRQFAKHRLNRVP